ncbi:hypothetical protein ACWDSL_49600 [Streptomyces sp. NPDC000941]
MALKPMPMKPETKPDPKWETIYQASHGGHYPKPEPRTPGQPKTGR